MPRKSEKVGVWLVGACGAVGCTVALGVAALGKRLTSTLGLVTELPLFADLDLPQPGSLVIGGHEIRSETLTEATRALNEGSGLFDRDLLRACAPRLRRMQANIAPGTLIGTSNTIRRLTNETAHKRDRTPAAAVRRLAADIQDFRRRHRLAHVVVVHLGSSEPPVKKAAAHASYAHLEKALARSSSKVLPSSSLYALAAVESGSAYVNFTPSAGIDIPAIRQRAEKLGLPYMGRDGKTGESLVKSALAPMFSMRNLQVMSWFGQNILGNRDGEVLRDPATRASKILSKDKGLSRILGRDAQTGVSIDYVRSLHDWKVAWDFIHFRGFLGTKMNMQFTWQGSDSILAAPLVIDLVRLAVRESRAGRAGPMKHLAFFFKDPLVVRRMDLAGQWKLLEEHVLRHG